MSLQTEIKRKMFHHLSLVYLLVYAFLPRPIAIWGLFVVLLGIGALEFIRLRRPELTSPTSADTTPTSVTLGMS